MADKFLYGCSASSGIPILRQKTRRFAWHLVAVALAFLASLSLNSCGSNVVGPLASAGIADWTVNKAIDHFRDVANGVMGQASQIADASIARAGNEISISTDNVGLLFDDKYNKLLRDLKPEEQNIFAHLVELEDDARKGIKTVQRTQELINLDLIQFTNRLRLISTKVPFYISSINGISVGQSEANHTIEIVGLGFGYNNGQENSALFLTIGGKEVPMTAFQRHSDKELSISIPAEWYKPAFKDRTASFIEAVFTVETPGSSHSKKNSVKFLLTVLPRYAGTVTVEESTVGLVRGTSDTYPLTKHVTASSTDHPNDWTQEWTCPNDCVIDSVEYSCTGGGCGFSYDPGPHKPEDQHQVRYDLSEGKKTVIVRRHCDGPDCDVTHTIHYTHMVEKSAPVPGVQHNLEFGRPLNLTLAKDNKNHEFKVSGKTFLGDDIYVDNNNANAASGPIKYISQGSFAGNYEVRFNVLERDSLGNN